MQYLSNPCFAVRQEPAASDKQSRISEGLYEASS
jgi:hypothetical protein